MSNQSRLFSEYSIDVEMYVCVKCKGFAGVTSLRHRRATVFSLSTSSFGASLYKRLATGNHDNIIFSPFSVYTALTMTLLGAGGDTERQLKVRLL